MNPEELIQQAREQLEGADLHADVSTNDEPLVRAVVGLGYALLAIAMMAAESREETT